MSKIKKHPTEMIHIRLPVSIKRQIEELAAKRHGRVSQTDIVIAALREYFDPNEADKKEVALLKRLEAMDRQLTHLKTQNEAIAESFAVYVRAYLTDMIALRGVTGINNEAITNARLKTDAVFKKFLEKIASNLNIGGEFFRNLPDQVFDHGQFATREIEDGRQDKRDDI